MAVLQASLTPSDLYKAAVSRLGPPIPRTRPNSGVNFIGPPVIPPAGSQSGIVPSIAPSPVPGGGGGPSQAGFTLSQAPGGNRWASLASGTGVPTVAQSTQGFKGITANPQLPQHPLGAYTDSTYEAENAILSQQTGAAYQDILQQTGYDDPTTGQHIMGDVELGAARKERDLLTGRTQAIEDVTGDSLRSGTIFSGYRAHQQARAETPFIQGLGDLAVDTPRTLGRLVEHASDLIREYTVQQNLLLVNAANRRLASLLAAQSQGPYGDGSGDPNAAAASGSGAGQNSYGAEGIAGAGGSEAAMGAYWMGAYPDTFGAGAGGASTGYGGLTDRGTGGMQPAYYTYRTQVQLRPGQTVHYTPGRGYYAA